MKIVSVIPLKKGILKTDLTYFTLKNIDPGSIVVINLRGKKTLGIAISSEEVSDSKIGIKGMDFNLKKILDVKDKSIFLKEYLEAVVLATAYFASSKSNGITSLIPAIMREEYDQVAQFENPKIKNSINSFAVQREKLLLQENFENRISIYKTLIRENFAKKKSVFIVLPTEHDIEVLEEHLSHGIEQFTHTIHGGFTPKKTLEKIKNIIESEHSVLVLATAPFLSIPRTDLGVVVLEHESSSSYKMISSPYFDLRIFVEIFASKINADFILSDTMLRFETIARREIDGLVPMHQLLFRIDFQKELIIENPRPKIEVTQDENSIKKIAFKILSTNTVNSIKNSLNRKQNVFIFTLRKGLATETICGDCAEVVSCDKCLAPLVLYSSASGKKRMFVCNRCGEEKPGETKCANCQSWNLVPLGIGTDTVVEELTKIFPETKIYKFDKESVKSKSAAIKLIKEYEDGKPAILVGTEMALHYMNNKTDLSVVASFDSFWSIPNFKISEKIIQLILSIIYKTENKFIIQTKNTADPTIKAIQNKNLISFIKEELKDRADLGYPPFKRFIKIKYVGSKEETIIAKETLKELFSPYNPIIFSGFVAQVRDKYVTNALIKIDTKDWSLSEISMNSQIDKVLLDKLLSLPMQFKIFVDPDDLV